MHKVGNKKTIITLGCTVNKNVKIPTVRHLRIMYIYGLKVVKTVIQYCVSSSNECTKYPRFFCEYFVTRCVLTARSFQHLTQPTKLEHHPLSAIRDCLFNIFAGTLHIAGRSSISNLRTRHAMVPRTHLSHEIKLLVNLTL